MMLICSVCVAQSTIYREKGHCGKNIVWTFDGKTLTINNESNDTKNYNEIAANSIEDYDLKNHVAPWVKKKLSVRSVHIGAGVKRIGSCAFANCPELNEVVFETNELKEIGWGAFYNCSHLRTLSLPAQLRNIETIAFANCKSITSVKIPDQCRVGDQAYVNCVNLQSLEVSPTSTVGQYAFAKEIVIGSDTRHALYSAEIRRMPAYINRGNCNTFGISMEALDKYYSNNGGSSVSLEDYDYVTSSVDTTITSGNYIRNDYYALIIGNQNYRYVPNVPFAIHDARVFAKYCEVTLGIPSENIHLCEDATKQIISEDEYGWLQSIQNREEKSLIIYYAGHGVPDTKNSNKAYLLPTDVRGTKPQYGVALDDFYANIGELAFNQATVFLDACFSGINRDNESVNTGMRGVEITAEEATLTDGKVIAFSAAQGNETAQGYQEHGHGLFTYYLLKNIQESDGRVFFGSLADYLKQNVGRTSISLPLRKSQTPTVNTTENVADSWRDIEL